MGKKFRLKALAILNNTNDKARAVQLRQNGLKRSAKSNKTSSKHKRAKFDLEAHDKTEKLQVKNKSNPRVKAAIIGKSFNDSEASSAAEGNFFFRKPKVISGKGKEINLQLECQSDNDEVAPLLYNVEKITNAKVTKVLLFGNQIDEADFGAESKTDSEDDIKAESKKNSEDDSDAESKTDSEDDVKAESKTDSEDDAKAESKTDSEDDSEAESKTDSEDDSEAESKTDSEDDSDAESKTNSEDDSDAESKAGFENDSEDESFNKSAFKVEDIETVAVQSDNMLLSDGAAESMELSFFENSLKTNNVLAVLKQDMEVYGTLVIRLLYGQITINGYKARPMESLVIYSPKGLNWVQILPMANKSPAKKFNWDELKDTFSRAQLEKIEANYNSERDAIVLLQRNSGAVNLIGTFAQHMAENVFPRVNSTNRPHYASEYLLNCLIQRGDESKALQIPTVWTKLPVQAGTRLMVTGGKGVGKSTLLRYLLNRHLADFPHMLFIDLDIGQPELFVPQTVSCSIVDAPLLGPGIFLNKQPEHAYVVGHVNVIMCPEQYLRAVRALLLRCHENTSYAKMPWLINTMGYNKGFSLELMSHLVDCVMPTDLVQISSAYEINNFDARLDREILSNVVPIIYSKDKFTIKNQCLKYTLHSLRSAAPQKQRQNRTWTMSAKDLRYSNLLSRLSAALRGSAKYLTDVEPLCVDLNCLEVIHLTCNEYTREELISGIEANLVFLCRRAKGDNPVECMGIGVVRAVDQERNKLYILPAMPLDRLKTVDCVVLGGELSLPQNYFRNQGPRIVKNVPFVFIIDDTKSSKSIQQIYFRTPGFLGNPNDRRRRQKALV